MRTSEIGIKLIHGFESFRNSAYLDSANVWTIGFGSTRIHDRPVRKGDYITKEEATEQFKQDLRMFEQYVESYVCVPLSQNQFDALVSLCYNIGQGNLKRSSVVKHLNEYNFSQASNAFLNHVYARDRKTGEIKRLRGLVRRRKAERELFLTSESGHHLEDLIKNITLRPIEKFVYSWQKKRYEQV